MPGTEGKGELDTTTLHILLPEALAFGSRRLLFSTRSARLQGITVVVTTPTMTLTMTMMMDDDVEYRHGDHDNIFCLSFAVFRGAP